MSRLPLGPSVPLKSVCQPKNLFSTRSLFCEPPLVSTQAVVALVCIKTCAALSHPGCFLRKSGEGASLALFVFFLFIEKTWR